MHFRTVRTTHKGKVTQYGQIVQSYRRESDGMPATKVLQSLGVVTDLQAENYKLAINASRLGVKVQIVDADFLARLRPSVAWTRDLADLCACLQAWQDSGMKKLLKDLFLGHGEDVPPDDVVAALVTQRCVAPASKLAATRWFPDTALPELLGISPAQFHNSRIHRVLERLEACDVDLQNGLSNKVLQQDGQPLTSFFIDCTDTWFVGHGPAMAQRGKTKEEFYRRKVGIVLLCRQDGMPLRFKVIQGNTDDGVAMLGLLDSLQAEPWLGSVPIVADRALGNTADFSKLIAQRIPFVTSLVAQEHSAYGAEVACPGLLELDHRSVDAMTKAGDLAVAAGMTRHADDLYVLDLSLIQRDQKAHDAVAAALGAHAHEPVDPGDDVARTMLVQAQRYSAVVKSGEVASFYTLQRGLGCSNGHMHRILSLLKLPIEIQAQIERGVARNLTVAALERLCSGTDADSHRTKFTEECGKAKSKKPGTPKRPAPVSETPRTPWVQLVAAFNPELWKQKRETAQEREADLVQTLEHQNARLLRTDRPVSLQYAASKVIDTIKKYKLSEVYAVRQIELAAGVIQLELVQDAQKWAQLRAHDGFQMIAASPDVVLSAVERVRLYRSKDAIEKDFREIKSVVELRPFRHRTDAKVRAHVTLCVLALVLQRWMQQALLRAGRSESAETAVDMLRNVRLCGLQFPETNEVIASPNAASPEQQAVAEALGIGWALDAERLKKHIKLSST